VGVACLFNSHPTPGIQGLVIKYREEWAGFQWPTPELFDKIRAAHPWSGTEKRSDPPLN